VEIPQRKGRSVSITRDEHPRPETTLEQLAALATPFRDNGSVTAGNASGVNDGACALLVASAEAALRLNLTPRARVVAAATAGVEPRIMGMGPVPATRRVLALARLTLEQMDVIELNGRSPRRRSRCCASSLPDESPTSIPTVAPSRSGIRSECRGAPTATWLRSPPCAALRAGTMCIGVGQGTRWYRARLTVRLSASTAGGRGRIAAAEHDADRWPEAPPVRRAPRAGGPRARR
jgi:hypothetical protein